MAYILQIPKTVQKQLQNIPEPFHSQIIESLQQLKDDPRSGNAIKMKGSEGYRLRVGNYRILYDINMIRKKSLHYAELPIVEKFIALRKSKKY
jgi:mRNA interferase RelE/StbE